VVIPFETSGGGGDTKEAIYTYFTSSGRQDTFRADVSAIPTNPLLTTDARLDNLDAAISSRLASAGYTAPANSDIAAIKAVTDALDVPTADATAAAILAAAQVTPIESNVKRVNDIMVTGSGTESDYWRPE